MHVSKLLSFAAAFGAASAQVVSQIADGQIQAPPAGVRTTFFISTVTLTTTAFPTSTSEPSPPDHWEVIDINIEIYRAGGHIMVPSRINSCTGTPCYSWTDYATTPQHKLAISSDMGSSCRYRWAGTNRGGLCGGLADHMDLHNNDAIKADDMRNVKHVCFEGDGPEEGQVFITELDLLWDADSPDSQRYWEDKEGFAELRRKCRAQFGHRSPYVERDTAEEYVIVAGH